MIYELPLSQIFADDIPSREHLRAEVVQRGIDMRVDWSGESERHARFEVQLSLDNWHQVPNPQPTRENDVVSPLQSVAGGTLQVRFERGPQHPGVPFLVRALPVEWAHEQGKLDAMLAASPEFIARRGTDYTYAKRSRGQGGPWIDATLEDGVYRATLELTIGTDYELWVRMQSPRHPDVWLEQDPIIRTIGGTTGGGNEDPL